MLRRVNASRRAVLAILLLLLAAAGTGIVLTRERPAEPQAAAPSAPAATPAAGPAPASAAKAGGAAPQAGKGGAKPGAGAPAGRRFWLVDMRPLLVARQLSAYAATPEEQELSRQAERLIDHAIDLAFVVAMRDATEAAPEQTPELRALAAARDAAQAAVDAVQARATGLERRIAAAPEDARQDLQDQLEVVRAELELDKDELASTSDALARAGGDPQARIRRLREVYDAAQKEPRPAVATPPWAGPSSSLLARLRAWTWHRDVLGRLSAARRDIADRTERIAKRRADLLARKEREAADREAAKAAAARLGAAGDGKAARAEMVKALAGYADDQRRLAAVGRRLQDLTELGETYGAWMAVVEGHARAALNRLLWGVLGLVALLALGFAAGEVVDRFFRRLGERLRVEAVRRVARLAVNVLTLLLGLFVVFGMPAQATTVVGLAGAGLTVAMKDFIVAFFGWFILMGRNGIRVGDWVEIEGVGGEVIEIGLFHTVLLETGNWSDAGHPTGRRVSFVNSFAIEGHYFNFSTSGQWMWDELRLLIPPGRDPYPVIDGVQRLVAKETADSGRIAEGEWRKATARYAVKAFSAAPGMQVIPTGGGIEVVVRYITRAQERHETRTRLYQAVLELLHGKRDAAPGEAGAGAAGGSA